MWVTALHHNKLQAHSYLGSGGRTAAGEVTWSTSCSWILNFFLQSCCVRAHWSRKHLHLDLMYLGCTRCGAFWREKGTLSWEQARHRSTCGNYLLPMLWNLRTNLSIILSLKTVFFFPLNNLFPFRETHTHSKIPFFFLLLKHCKTKFLFFVNVEQFFKIQVLKAKMS